MAVPTEHGGWSLTAEPAVLGLLVAWSWSGLALAVAAMAAFVARTPLKLVLVDRWRRRWLDRTRLAARIAGFELVLIAALGMLAAVGAQNRWFWVPLAAAVPLVAAELWFDMRSRSRRLVPELAGTIGIGSVVAAIVLAGGESTALAVGLWVVVASRAAAAIPYARCQVFRTHDRDVVLWPSDLAQVLAVAAVVIAAVGGGVPVASALVVAMMGVFHIGALRRPPQRIMVVGLQQVAFGVAVVVVTAIAVLV